MIAKKHSLAVMSSSESVEWYTPTTVIALATQVLGAIDLDPASCAVANETVGATRFYDQAADGLLQPWSGRVWLNPPYGAAIDPWIERLNAAYMTGAVTEAIALVPARVDTKWWWRMRYFPVCFWSGRIRFLGTDNSAPFPCAIFYLGQHLARFVDVFSRHGIIYRAVEQEFVGHGRIDATQQAFPLLALVTP